MPKTITKEIGKQLDLAHRAYDSLIDKLLTWFEELVKMLPNFVVAILVFLLFYFIAKGVRRVIKNAMERWVDNKNLIRLVSSISFYVLLAIGMFVALEALELGKAVTSLLAGAGVVGLALSFAFQDLATNFVSGILIIVQKPLKVGDYVQSNDFKGHVRKIGFRSVDIEDLDGQYVIIPSKEVFQNPLINYFKVKKRRVTVPVGISYGDNMRKVEQLLKKSIQSIKGEEFFDVRIDFEGFGDSSVNFLVRFWTKKCDEADYWHAYTQAGIAIKEAFDENDIMIPFPIRTLDFGIRGGEKLQEHISFLKEKSASDKGEDSSRDKKESDKPSKSDGSPDSHNED